MRIKTQGMTALCIAGFAVSLFGSGCGDREKYGKYTEEQMQQIGIVNGRRETAPH